MLVQILTLRQFFDKPKTDLLNHSIQQGVKNLMDKIYRITRAAELESLGIFRDFIAAGCRENEISDDVSYDLQLAADEACTNIIQHGYAGMDPGSIILELNIDSRSVTVLITDFGYPFEPSSAPKPDLEAALEDRPLGGFGLFFIYSTMDSVDYQTTEMGNTLILKKKLN
jgi:anti-sigma regulatory factor (Ser/Thr protein kinase)